MRFLNLSGLWLFITASAAIIPLAKILGSATEELALRVGSDIGGLLNATFGNAVEMIIAFFALQAGLYEVVKASITGSIIGNVLFVLVLLGFFIGRPLDLFFNLFELAAIGATMLIATAITQDGESNWFEGVQLLAACAIMAVAFFHP